MIPRGKAQHEMRVHHGVLQLGTLAFNFFRHRLAGNFSQGRNECIDILQAHQRIKAANPTRHSQEG